ncbi:MAG TPA: WecB/TagA/CpsF family glycosyltransferase [candidate division Zixibacteria bacterium]|nr:WecB/TagA/CpsF family glycosyltransferase [candidate division Zixibacteria bacterium]
MDKNGQKRVSLLGVEIDPLPLDRFLQRLEEKMHRGKGAYVVTPNVDHIVRLKTDGEFREIYRQASFVVPDGMPLVWASRWLGKPLPERITGADLLPRLSSRAAENGRSIFLLGATPPVCRQVMDRLRRENPAIKIAGHYSPPFGFEKCRDELDKIVRALKQAKPDVVFAALGTPKQEKLIFYLRNRVPVKLFLGVGAALDFYSGQKKRAPTWLQKAGLEWVFRLVNEPARLWKRYLVDDPRFFWWVAKEKFSGNKND